MKQRHYFLGLLFLFSLSPLGLVQAVTPDFYPIAREFLGTSYTARQREFDRGITLLSVEQIRLANQLVFSLNGSHKNDQSDSFSFFNNASNQDNYQATLSKGLAWGGVLSFTNQWSAIENPSVFGIDKVYSFSQTLGYTQDIGQDFFGKNYRSQLRVADHLSDQAQVNLQSELHTALVDFYQQFLRAKLQKTLVFLREESLKRAKKREADVRRRVRDGLSETVDLHEARILTLSSKETLASTVQAFNEARQILSISLLRSIKPEEIRPYASKGLMPASPLTGRIEKNFRLQGLKIGKDMAHEEVKQETYRSNPDVQLFVNYQTNKIDQDLSTTFEEGKLGEDARSIEVGIQLSYPIGTDPQEKERAKKKVQALQSELNYRSVQVSLKREEGNLQSRLKQIEQNLISVEKRRGLAKRAVASHTKLYNLGRSDLNSVLQAEERLISTLESIANYLQQRDEALSQLALVYGIIDQFFQIGE